MHYGKKNNNKSFLFLMLLLIILFSMNIIIINGYKIIDGLSVAINGANEIIPYSTRSSYITLCEKKHIEPIDECATALESKTIERLLELENIRVKYLELLAEMSALKQQNIILQQQQQQHYATNIDSIITSDNVIDINNHELRQLSINQYTKELSNLTIHSFRKHFCHDKINQLPIDVMEPIYETDNNNNNNNIKTIPITLKQLVSRYEFALMLNKLKLNGEAAELGVHRGEFSHNFLSLWNAPGRLHLVDVWEEIDNYDYDRQHDYQLTIDKLSKFGSERYNIVKKFTTEAAFLYPKEYFDFIYLDASHTYESSRRDIQMWWPKLKQGGIFAGDDYINGNVNVAGYRFGVKDAVDEFASIYNLRVNIIWKDRKPEAGGPMPQWYLYKC